MTRGDVNAEAGLTAQIRNQHDMSEARPRECACSAIARRGLETVALV
jgi:hypothetical protein